MKDFAHDYIDYSNMAKQLIPETNTVQHWSKIIETKNHLEDMRKCFMDPVNSGAFDNVTHGLGLGMLDAALDMVIMVIEQQIRILSGAAASDPADSAQPMRLPHKASAGVNEKGKVISKGKARGKARKKISQESAAAVLIETQTEQCQPDDAQGNVLTLVSVGYETVSSGLNTTGIVGHNVT
ncbi:hypothetical protein F7725_014520 [Dissostichus mawsoni]|uniref:Uncharacterized protein n=1 Tax=Dissostichus mawsoni TaxID=36200 RepID=A0A7J5YW56_DISMA|nr:hypothetical protein F7725_014520 [Dissostichus mawsoni]